MSSDHHRGAEFYETEAQHSAYLRHRHGRHSPNTVMEEPAFHDAIGDLQGFRVLDLGCGDGSTARMISEAGARSYVGVDGSATMIETAEQLHGSPQARFVCGDIEDPDSISGTFDLVISRMALHYVERLEVVIDRIRLAMPVGGRMIFSVVHPIITSDNGSAGGTRTTWTVDRYFDRGPRDRSWFGSTVRWYHRTTEDYVRIAADRGFRIESLSECEPRAELLAGEPAELARRRRVPLMLLLVARREV